MVTKGAIPHKASLLARLRRFLIQLSTCMKPARSFASDNNAGVHPKIIQAISAVNQGHTVGYGDDPYTKSALAKFRENFGRGIETFVVFNGTAANVLSFAALTNPYHAVVCAAA